MLRLAKLCEAHRRHHQEDGEDRHGGRVLPLAGTARRGDLGGLPLRAGLPGIRRTHAPDWRRAAVEAWWSSLPAEREALRCAPLIASAAISARQPTMCCCAKAPTSATITLQDVRSIFDQIAETRTATAKAAILKSLAGTRHRARSQVHPEDHHRRTAHRPERKPGRRGDCQGLRRAAGPGAARQHAARRYRRHLATGGGASSRPGADAAVSSHRLHAGQSGDRCGRSLPVLRARAGRGQVRRHPRPGALRRRAGAHLLAHAR